MIKKIREFLKNKSLVQDTFNVLLGIVMLLALIFYVMTQNRISMYVIIIAGIVMNLTTGLKLYHQKKKRNLGMSMMLMSGIILFLLVYLILQ